MRCFFLPPPRLVLPPPPPLARFYSPLGAGINRFCDVGACRLTQGVPPRFSIFLFSPPHGTASCKPHMHNDVFFRFVDKSPSYAFNLVGNSFCRRRKRPHIGLLSLAALAEHERIRLIAHKRKTPEQANTLDVEATVHHHQGPEGLRSGCRGGFIEQSTNRACGAAFA